MFGTGKQEYVHLGAAAEFLLAERITHKFTVQTLPRLHAAAAAAELPTFDVAWPMFRLAIVCSPRTSSELLTIDLRVIRTTVACQNMQQFVVSAETLQC
jgi:hypothetical protein